MEQYQSELEAKVRVAGLDTPPQLDFDDLPEILEPDVRPKRTRSFVDNVKGFFIPRPSSPSPSQSSAYSSQVSSKECQNGFEDRPEKTSDYVFTRLWRNSSLRHRVRSAPDVPATGSSTHLRPDRMPLPTIYSPPQSGGFLSRSSSLLGVHMHMRHSADEGERITTINREIAQSASTSHVGVQRRRSVFSSGRTQFTLSKRTSNSRLIPRTMMPLTPMVVEKAS